MQKVVSFSLGPNCFILWLCGPRISCPLPSLLVQPVGASPRNPSPQVPDCCPGFFGTLCEPCPGRLGAACSGHGRCQDGLLGSGECRCHEGFHGTACEMCELGRYGPNCTGGEDGGRGRNGGCPGSRRQSRRHHSGGKTEAMGNSCPPLSTLSV